MKYFLDFSLISIVGATYMTLIPAMIASVETMLEGWKNNEGKEIEVYQEFRLLTAEVISRTTFLGAVTRKGRIFLRS
ncbi:Cytochrome P [Trema orientale]|uniref:Cytochrome P n=1 Tax=Trema orientale TaxID=63057 RepID=A0A2P5FHL0_TREOI|nr:Cytochrome P [Trema orientale]